VHILSFGGVNELLNFGVSETFVFWADCFFFWTQFWGVETLHLFFHLAGHQLWPKDKDWWED
jgi:hypothetical protein